MCSVSINYNGGVGLWVVLGSDIPVDCNGHGQYDYKVPSGDPRIEEHCKIRIIANDTNHHQGIDMSDNDFTIEFLRKTNDEPIPRNEGEQIPACTFLDPLTPNPFNSSSDIHFGLKESAFVSLRIFDVTGKLVKTIYHDFFMAAGTYHDFWYGCNDEEGAVDSGVYFLQLRAGSFVKTQKVVLVR